MLKPNFHTFVVAGTLLLVSGCYTLKQGYYQGQLLTRRTPISDVLEKEEISPELREKLKFVPQVLDYAKNNLGLETGNSYRHYIALDGDAVTYVVQAAERRKLERKTWWFPIVGSQPYLGFFKKEDAIEFQKELKQEGFDTSLGGVEAFSLLGFFPDPIYSSMIDDNNYIDIAELLFHECTHLTLYIPNFSSFNENLADFVARKSIQKFFEEHKEHSDALRTHEVTYAKEQVAAPLYRQFLETAKQELETFYASAAANPDLQSDSAFLEAREAKFNELSESYRKHMNGLEIGTRYAWYFRKGHINNAVILGYSLYQAKQEPFEAPFARAQQNVRLFLDNLEKCWKAQEPKTEEQMWRLTEACGEEHGTK